MPSESLAGSKKPVGGRAPISFSKEAIEVEARPCDAGAKAAAPAIREAMMAVFMVIGFGVELIEVISGIVAVLLLVDDGRVCDTQCLWCTKGLVGNLNSKDTSEFPIAEGPMFGRQVSPLPITHHPSCRYQYHNTAIFPNQWQQQPLDFS